MTSAPRFCIRKTDDDDTVREMAATLFHRKELEREELHESCTHWIAYDEDNDPVAYLSARMDGSRMYIASVGVLPHARGNRLQRRLMRAALLWGKREGAVVAWSYTSSTNVASMNSFIAAGFTVYLPDIPVDARWVYWRKPLVAAIKPVPGVH